MVSERVVPKLNVTKVHPPSLLVRTLEISNHPTSKVHEGGVHILGGSYKVTLVLVGAFGFAAGSTDAVVASSGSG